MRCDILPRTYRMVRYRLWQNFPMRLNTAACGKLIPRQHAMRWKMLPVSWGSPTKCQDHHKPPRAVLEDRNSFESSCMMKCWRELVFFSEFLAVRCIRCHGVSFLLDMFCFSATHCEGYREKRTASIFLLHFVHHHSSQSIQYSVLLLCVWFLAHLVSVPGHPEAQKTVQELPKAMSCCVHKFSQLHFAFPFS